LVVHTLGRFIFAPLLPYFINDGMLTAQQGAQLAALNYAGYMIGALLALRWHRPEQLRRVLPAALVLNALITLAQVFTFDPSWLQFWRLASGVTNGIVFVQAPALVLEWLARHGRIRLSGLTYFGVSVGLLVSSGLVEWPSEWLSGPERWWPAALIALPLALWSGLRLWRLDTPTSVPQPDSGHTKPSGRLFDRASVPLFLAYAGAGLGYILPMTFLPVVAVEVLGGGEPLIGHIWLWVAVATLPSIWLWNYLGGLWGDRTALLVNYALQTVGVASPLLWPSAFGLILCAGLVGGTFIGTVMLTQRLGRALHPHQGPRLSAALIALYSFTQLMGPWLAEQWLVLAGNLSGSFWFGVGALIWALAWSLRVPEPHSVSRCYSAAGQKP
ncbi:YbfB/YjiJ family MFS transporter, partial [Alkalilimnicola ehrlichii]